MTLRLIRRPTSSWRYPVSIGCWIRMRTSMTSPRLASRGIWILAATIFPSGSALVQTGGERDHDGRRVVPERSVGELRDGGHTLAAGEPHARVDLGLARARAQIEIRHVRHRVPLRVQVDALYVIGGGHGAVHRDPDRNGVAVVGELRQDERHLALPHRGAVGLRERRARKREGTGCTGEKIAALHCCPLSVASQATTSSTCCAESRGLPRKALAT